MYRHLSKRGFYIKIRVDCGNPMTSKMVDWKIQTNLTRVKSIQYDAVGELFLHKWGGLEFQSSISEAFGLTF